MLARQSPRPRISVGPAGLTGLLESMSRQGMAVRPRALVTTPLCPPRAGPDFFAWDRWCQVRSDYRCHHATYVGPAGSWIFTLSSTHFLPVALPDSESVDLVRLERLQRELQFHPELHIAAESAADPHAVRECLGRKRQLLASIPPRGERRQWQHALQQLNDRLARWTRPTAEELATERKRLQDELKRKSLLASRETVSACMTTHCWNGSRSSPVAQLRQTAGSPGHWSSGVSSIRK